MGGEVRGLGFLHPAQGSGLEAAKQAGSDSDGKPGEALPHRLEIDSEVVAGDRDRAEHDQGREPTVEACHPPGSDAGGQWRRDEVRQQGVDRHRRRTDQRSGQQSLGDGDQPDEHRWGVGVQGAGDGCDDDQSREQYPHVAERAGTQRESGGEGEHEHSGGGGDPPAQNLLVGGTSPEFACTHECTLLLLA